MHGQQLYTVMLPTADSYTWPTAVHGHVTHFQQLCMTSSCIRLCYTLPTVMHGQQLYTVMLHTTSSYAWPIAANSHVAHCQQLCMANSCTRSCYPLLTFIHGQQLYTVMLHTANSYSTKVHGASNQHMAKSCMGISYTWPAVTRGLVIYSQ
jgi:hypothetical protein